MSWRYQPVWTENGGERDYTIIEVYFDDSGTFYRWTEGPAFPVGDTPEGLSRDINRMLVDAMCWEPVALADIKHGFQFQKRVSMEDRLALADYINETADAIKRQPKPQTN